MPRLEDSRLIDELREKLVVFSDHVSRERPHITDEAAVRTVLVDSLLHEIHWSPRKISRVRTEYPVQDSGKADYALLDKSSQPLIIIEAKNVDVQIGDQLPPDQLKRYVHPLPRCNVGVWTNGLAWYWFCLDFTNTLSDTPFLTFDVSEQDWISPQVLRWLLAVQDQFAEPRPKKLLTAARELEYRDRLDKWWGQSVRQPSDGLAKLLWKELSIKKRQPSNADLGMIKQVWIAVHGKRDAGQLRAVPLANNPQEQSPAKPDTKPRPEASDPPVPQPSLDGGSEAAEALELQLADGTIHYATSRQRAWRVWNRKTGRWDPWTVESSATAVQISMAAWMIRWNGGRVPTIRGLEKGEPRTKTWKRIPGKQACAYTNLSNAHKRDWILRLASKVRDASRRSPVPGRDFEFWLPTAQRRTKY